ncbi:hypothetical protein HOP50_16g77610 [Chloropicon primus]|uniref:Uncharacterized protein n=1 Tax=Chloropicon primus TaxID=1764295 RepID=A0A5B8MZW2_9CHLO|nr:hypothetical protein A3770_16p77330 [Chloropicon primus]UPR04420.1 hypothetical protein HOP50_16g77610 [Chloropicon primus]|eukprot:QDZ25215.1 hypothetical protein A3770_16p77330 [Chloropicon primus]
MEGSSEGAMHPALHLRTVQILLWEVIAPKITAVERDEVELVLGRLVEENGALFEEANMLGGILQDLEGDIEGVWSKRKLIDTPARAMLERDLRKMLSTLKFTLGSSGLCSTSLSTKEKKVLDYLQATARPDASRPGSASAGQLGLTRPYTPRSRPASSCSTSSRPSTAGSSGSFSNFALPDVYKVLQQVESKLNVFDIDTIAPTLKQVLLAEHEALLEDIEYLQQCLQDRSGEREANLQPPPSMNDLKDFSKTLQGVEKLSQVEAKLLDVSNSLGTDRGFGGANILKVHQNPDIDAPQSLGPSILGPLDPAAFGGSQPMLKNALPPPLPPVNAGNRVPRAPSSKPTSAKPPSSSRARRLRGLVSENRTAESNWPPS